MQRVARADRLMEKLVASSLLTEAGKNYLIASIDPFHDTPIDCCGIPDGQPQNNVVQTIKQTMQISTPSNLSAGATWDCYITLMPWISAISMSPIYNLSNSAIDNTQLNMLYTVNSESVNVIDSLVAISVPSSELTSGNVSFTKIVQVKGSPASGEAYNGLSMPSAYLYDKRRVVGMGFEVYNTTAQLYKGGSCITWRSPVPDMNESQGLNIFQTNGSGGIVGPNLVYPGVMFEGPPSSPANAILLPNSRQWDAEKGAYVVAAFHGDSERNSTSRQWKFPIITTTTSSGTPTPLLWGSSIYDVGAPIGGTAVSGINNVEWSHSDMSGAYFTGLAQGSTLTINFNIILEKFPGLDDINLSVLSKPAPLQDDNALELYSRIVRDLPVGVPVDQNGFGDWFAGIVNDAKEFISPVLSMIPHPAAQGAAKLIDGASSIMNRNSASEKLNARVKAERRQRKRQGKALY